MKYFRLVGRIVPVLAMALALLSIARAEAVTQTMRSPLWSEDGSYVLVTTDKWCHETNCDGYGVRPGGQDAVLKRSNGTSSTNARVLTPLSSGQYGIITKIWTADGYYKNLGGGWTYSGHGYGNGYDLYVGQNPSYGAIIYRFAHMRTDGFWFWSQGAYVYPFYNTGNKLSWGQVMGIEGQTGYAIGDHLHWELIIGSTRFEPTYSYLDNIGATYGQYSAAVDAVTHSCVVTASNNCSPSVAPLSASSPGSDGPVLASNGLALESGLKSLSEIPGYGADDVSVEPSPPGMRPHGKKGEPHARPTLRDDEVTRVLPSGEVVTASEMRPTSEIR